jgi:hypothetical protein
MPAGRRLVNEARRQLYYEAMAAASDTASDGGTAELRSMETGAMRYRRAVAGGLNLLNNAVMRGSPR